MKIVLSVNAGSSSVKISVYNLEAHGSEPHHLADAQVSGLTAPPPRLKYTRADTTVHDGTEVTSKVSNQSDAFALLLQTLVDDPQLSQITDAGDVNIVAHRIVHGGDYPSAKLLDKDTMHHLDQLSDLAPLHNGAALEIVRSCVEQLPAGARNVAVFDSAFHASLPEHVYTYPIDPVIAKKNMLRKYGFHGISYSFITRTVARYLGKEVGETNIIALHLGSGASACAIKSGKSWDTSMGLTPLAGLPGATRSGSVDPSLVFHYASDIGKLSPSSTSKLHISRAEEILNREAGWKALTGTTDFANIASSDDPTHRLAFDLFVDRVAAFVGSYYVSLEGQVDAIVFAGGIGEKSAKLRQAVGAKCRCLGFEMDEAGNEAEGEEASATVREIGKRREDAASHRVLVCLTDEQFEMARVCGQMNELWR